MLDYGNWPTRSMPRTGSDFYKNGEKQMQIGMIGLGKMGGNMSRRLMKAGHTCVVYARTAKTREELAKDGANAAASIADLVKSSGKSRALFG